MIKKDILKVIEKDFEFFRNEVGDYKPEGFDYLEKRFYELYETDIYKWRKWTHKEIREGKSPVKQWLCSNHYPINEHEKCVLQFVNALTDESAEEYLCLMKKFLFKLKNSKALRTWVDRLHEHGMNSVAIFLEEKNNFRPVLKELSQIK